MEAALFSRRQLETPRHRTARIEAGPADGPLLIFVHGWRELGRVWGAQMAYFAAPGWRCVAPDMRGYGGSAVPGGKIDYLEQENTKRFALSTRLNMLYNPCSTSLPCWLP